jgi:hypothetical protein
MAAKIFVVLDTNILIQLVTQSRPGCDLKAWTTLKQLEKRAVSVLLPEVIELIWNSRNSLTITQTGRKLGPKQA